MKQMRVRGGPWDAVDMRKALNRGTRFTVVSPVRRSQKKKNATSFVK